MPHSIPSLAELHAIGAAQQPRYPDAEALAAAVAELRRRPPLVFAGECDELKARVADVAAGLPGEPNPAQARWIEATVAGVRVVSVYVPNGQAVGTPPYPR